MGCECHREFESELEYTCHAILPFPFTTPFHCEMHIGRVGPDENATLWHGFSCMGT